MKLRGQRICAWSGIFLLSLFFLGFWIIARFMPPPSPLASGHQVSNIYLHHTLRTQVGIMLAMFAIGVLPAWDAAVAIQLKRIEGNRCVWAYAMLGLGCIGTLEFLIPMMFWETIAFRSDLSPELVRLVSDLGWIPFVALVQTGIPWVAVVGAGILSDDRELPVYPRWSGYYCLAAAALLLPGTAALFTKRGPFAWNGAIAFWEVFVDFSVWMLVMTFLTLRAIRSEELTSPGVDAAS